MSLFTIFFILVYNLFPGCYWGKQVMPEEDTSIATDSLQQTETKETKNIQVGAERMELLLPKLSGKRVGVVANQSSLVGSVHLVDTLLSAGAELRKILVPEHGFRGQEDRGKAIQSGTDEQTGLPIISLYGSHKKPTEADLSGLDLILFDLQDVGTRFYTYISSMHYVMEAAAENGLEVIVLDRPNPNGHYVDGPIRKPAFKSFVGMHPIPVVHGMTVGELAGMINGEGWLKDGLRCDLEVIPCSGYDHETFYELPVRPSPNLPNMRSVYLYPSLCFFEGTIVSVGRGTDFPFQVYGSPDFSETGFIFIPAQRPGASKPMYEGEICKGFDLRGLPMDDLRNTSTINLNYLVYFYQAYPYKEQFFRQDKFFDLLAGTDQLRQQIQEGMEPDEIRESWQEELGAFKQLRKQYLLYPDFE